MENKALGFANMLHELSRRLNRHIQATAHIVKCEHKNLIISRETWGEICTDCGMEVEKFFANDCETSQKWSKRSKYTRERHLRAQMEKFEIDGYKNQRSDLVPLMPIDIKGIRAFMRLHKIDQKYDVLYWKLRNGVTTRLRREDMMNWEREFKRGRGKKTKDFLFDKMLGHPTYGIFTPLLERKCQKKPRFNRTATDVNRSYNHALGSFHPA